MLQKKSSLVFLQYMTTVFDNLDEAIFLIGVEPDETYRLLVANKAFLQDTGHAPDDIGKVVEQILEPSTYTLLKKRYAKVVQSKQPTEHTEWYTVPNGHYAYQVKFTPILNAVGECVQITGISRNVTELHNLRTEVQDLRRQLYNANAKPAGKKR